MPRKRKNPVPQEVIDFGIRVRELRKEKNLTQMDLGAACNIDKENIRKYEKGLQEPKLTTIIKFAKAFNVEINALIILE